MIEKARIFSQEKHAGHFRKFGGKPYFTHPEGAVNILRKIIKDEEILSAAYLHDTIEDCDTTYEEIRKNFGKRVADLVLELTNDKKKVKKLGKKEYLAEKVNLMSEDAFLIKLADRLDNLAEIHETDDAFRERYIHQTLYIMEHINRIIKKEHSILIDRIREILTRNI